jgi:hypothetical protein
MEFPAGFGLSREFLPERFATSSGKSGLCFMTPVMFSRRQSSKSRIFKTFTAKTRRKPFEETQKENLIRLKGEFEGF